MQNNLYLHAGKQQNTAKEHDIDTELVEVKRDKWQPFMLISTQTTFTVQVLQQKNTTI